MRLIALSVFVHLMCRATGDSRTFAANVSVADFLWQVVGLDSWRRIILAYLSFSFSGVY